MNQNHFIMRRRKLAVIIWLFVALLFWATAIFASSTYLMFWHETVSFIDVFMNIPALSYLLLLLPTSVYSANALIWKCTVQGENIRYRSLFFRKEFTFRDIERVAFHEREFGSMSAPIKAHYWRIFLTGKKLPLIVSAQACNSHAFMRCLRDRKTPGSSSREMYIPIGTDRLRIKILEIENPNIDFEETHYSDVIRRYDTGRRLQNMSTSQLKEYVEQKGYDLN